MSVLPAVSTTNFEHDPFPSRQALEELWRQQVANIVDLSRDALTPNESDGFHASELLLSNQLLAVARQQLDETEAALARLQDGTYGRCEDCSSDISAERLEILPAARYRLACQAARSLQR
jgi:DnaK suppressor protein